ncbi:15812_t:CDS:2, partial [Funneliformis geosporum]
TSASNNTSEDTPLNSTSEDTPFNSILKDIPSTCEIPSCFEGLEEQWADLNKNGRDFRKEIWFKTHIDQAKKENITPLEHLADFLRRAYQEEEEDLREEVLSEEDNEDSNYQEFELCLTDESSSDEDPIDR